jgi:UDP-glucose 4-epimerase
MQILITGGAGFIGSHLAEHLSKRGDQVFVIDNLSTGRKTNIDGLNVRFFYEDISDPRAVQSIFKEVEPEVVVHAAASYKDPENWGSDVSTNCLGTVNVVKSSEEYKIKRLIYFNTSLCYGILPKESPITTSCVLNPTGSSYAISKTVGEQYIRLSSLNYISFRLANCYGERTRTGPIPAFYKKLISEENCVVVNTRRDFIYVRDLCELVIRSINGEGQKGIYHISTGFDYSIEELYLTVCEALGVKKDPIRKERGGDDAPTLLIDPSKTHKDFAGWVAKTSLKEGITKTIDFYKKERPTEIFTHLRLESDSISSKK